MSLQEDTGWFFIQNKEFLKIDYTNVKDDELAVKIAQYAFSISSGRPDKSIRLLNIVNGSKMTPSGMREIVKIGKKVQPKIKRSAIVGSSGLLSVLLKLYVYHTGSKMLFFTDEKLALKYVLSEE